MSTTISSFADSTDADNMARRSDFASTEKSPDALSFPEVMKQQPKQSPSIDGKQPNDADTVTRNGEHIEIERADRETIPIERDILEGNASADSLNIEKHISFNVSPDGKSLQNVKGLSLTVSAFGAGKELGMKQVDLAYDSKAQPAVTAHVENPLSVELRSILSMPDTIAIPIPVNIENGELKFPQPSSIFQATANSAGNTLPGLVFSDAFKNLAEISKFAEDNPEWIHDVIKPMFDEVRKEVNKPSAAQTASPAKTHSTGQKTAQPANKETPQAKTNESTQETTHAEADNVKGIPGEYEQTITVDGKERHYLLHVPKGYDAAKPIPLLIMLHGRGGDGKEFAERTGMNEKADKEGFAVAYPSATKWFDRKDLSAWDAANGLVPPGGRANDLDFLRKVIDRSQSQLTIDPKRIFMIGHSSGGMMTYLAASEMSDKLAAVGIVSSAMSGKEPKPEFPVSVISTHGTDDEVIPIEGLQGVPPILTEIGIPTFKTPHFATEFWKRQNGISESGTVTQEGDTTTQLFQNKRNGTAVEEITLKNSGHTPEDKFHVYDKIWTFLKEHPKAEGLAAPSNDPKQLIDERTNPLQSVLDNIKKRGPDGIADDVANLYTHVSILPDGSIYPSKILEDVENKLGTQIHHPVSAFIENSTELSKKGNKIELDTNEPSVLTLNQKFGIGNIESMELSDVKFDLGSEKGKPKLEDIQGVSLKMRALGQALTSNLHSITDQEDGNGRHTYIFTLDNPLPAPVRWLMMSSSNINVGMQVDNKGDVRVGNQNTLTDELLGKNPITRGYIDQAADLTNLLSNPCPETMAATGRDLAFTGGLAGIGLLAPRYKIPLSIVGGFLVAPAATHFLKD